jgi:hypothetical protein
MFRKKPPVPAPRNLTATAKEVEEALSEAEKSKQSKIQAFKENLFLVVKLLTWAKEEKHTLVGQVDVDIQVLNNMIAVLDGHGATLPAGSSVTLSDGRDYHFSLMDVRQGEQKELYKKIKASSSTTPAASMVEKMQDNEYIQKMRNMGLFSGPLETWNSSFDVSRFRALQTEYDTLVSHLGLKNVIPPASKPTVPPRKKKTQSQTAEQAEEVRIEQEKKEVPAQAAQITKPQPKPRPAVSPRAAATTTLSVPTSDPLSHSQESTHSMGTSTDSAASSHQSDSPSPTPPSEQEMVLSSVQLRRQGAQRRAVVPTVELFAHPSDPDHKPTGLDLKRVGFYFDFDGTATKKEGQDTFGERLFKKQKGQVENGIIEHLEAGDKATAERLYSDSAYAACRVTEDMINLVRDIQARGGDVNFITNNAAPYVEFSLGLAGLPNNIQVEAARPMLADVFTGAKFDKEELITKNLNVRETLPEKFVVVDDDIQSLWKMVKGILVKLNKEEVISSQFTEEDNNILYVRKPHKESDEARRERCKKEAALVNKIRDLLKQENVNNLVFYQPAVGEKWQPTVMAMVGEMMKAQPHMHLG